MAASDGEAFSIEQFGLGEIIDVDRDEVFSTLEMTFFQGFL